MSSEVAAYFPSAMPDSSELGLPAATTSQAIHSHSKDKSSENTIGVECSSIDSSSESLFVQVGSGSKEALSILFHRHAKSVLNVAQRILGDRSEAEDILQEVFLLLFQRAGLFDPAKGDAASWIIQITYHRAFDRRRYLNARNFYTTIDIDDSTLQLAGANVDRPVGQHPLREALGQELADKLHSCLSSEQQNTIQLYFFEGHTLREIAEHTGQSLANVRSHYYRGLERLRRYVHKEKLPPK